MKIVITQQRVLAGIGIMLLIAVLIAGWYHYIVNNIRPPFNSETPGFPGFLVVTSIIVTIILAIAAFMGVMHLIFSIAIGDITLFNPITIDTSAKRIEAENLKTEVNKLLAEGKYEEAEKLLKQQRK